MNLKPPALNDRSKSIRRSIITLSQANGGYHYGGSFSCAEVLIALFDEVLHGGNKFIMSKGHACWGYYVLLQERGFSPLLEGHPHLDESNGVNFTSGSEGHGMPAAVGMAMARKLLSKEGKIFVLVGDGECQEGTTWESLLIAGHHKLSNLVVIVDNNKIQGSGFVGDILPITPLKAAAEAEGWDVLSADGHDVVALTGIFIKATSKPLLVIANTKKGMGVSFMENNPVWHAKFLDAEHEKIALKELA